MKIMNSTKDYIRTVLDTIRYDFGDLMLINIYWVLLMLPIITIPPAFAGLYYSTTQLVQNETVTRQTFIAGFKKYFRTSYVWFFSNVFVVGLLLFNIDLSIRVPGLSWLQNLTGVYWVLLAAWTLLQIYSFPLLILQDKPKLVLALRNSAILWFKHILFSLILSVVTILLVGVSIYLYPLWFVIAASFIAYLANLGVVFLLSKE
jgi:uncharacterized membrane protein YesL